MCRICNKEWLAIELIHKLSLLRTPKVSNIWNSFNSCVTPYRFSCFEILPEKVYKEPTLKKGKPSYAWSYIYIAGSLHMPIFQSTSALLSCESYEKTAISDYLICFDILEPILPLKFLSSLHAAWASMTSLTVMFNNETVSYGLLLYHTQQNGPTTLQQDQNLQLTIDHCCFISLPCSYSQTRPYASVLCKVRICDF